MELKLDKVMPTNKEITFNKQVLLKSKNEGITTKPINFLSFVKQNSERFLNVAETFAMSVAPLMNQFDKRWMISNLFVHIICDEFKNDIFDTTGSQKGFDLLYHDGIKISVKSGTNVFQRYKKSGTEFTNAKIILKNGMGDNKISNPIFDYLLTVSRNYNTQLKRYEYGFGVVNLDTVLEYSKPSKKGDQIISSIPNHAYDYYSGIHYTIGRYKGEQKNAIVNECQKVINMSLIGMV
jgi:hypothetical protein